MFRIKYKDLQTYFYLKNTFETWQQANEFLINELNRENNSSYSIVEKKFLTVGDLVEMDSYLNNVYPPKDSNKKGEGLLLEQYFSESKGEHWNLLDMPINYMIRAFNKTLKKLNKLENKKFKVTLSVDEAYSIILDAKSPKEAEEMALNIMNEQDPPYNDFKIEDGQGVSIEDTEEIK